MEYGQKMKSLSIDMDIYSLIKIRFLLGKLQPFFI